MRYLGGRNRATAMMAALAAASLVHARSLPAQRISPTPPSCTVAGERSAQAASASARSPAEWTVAVLAFDVRSGTREAPAFASSLASAIARRLGSTQRIAVRDRELQSRRASPAAPPA